MAPRPPGPPRWVTRGSAPWVPYLRRKCFCRMAFRRPCGSEGGAEVRFERASCPFGSAHPGVLAGRPTLKGPCALAPADQCPGIMKAISPWGGVAVNSGFPGGGERAHIPEGLVRAASGVGESAGTRREGSLWPCPHGNHFPGGGDGPLARGHFGQQEATMNHPQTAVGSADQHAEQIG